MARLRMRKEEDIAQHKYRIRTTSLCHYRANRTTQPSRAVESNQPSRQPPRSMMNTTQDTKHFTFPSCTILSTTTTASAWHSRRFCLCCFSPLSVLSACLPVRLLYTRGTSYIHGEPGCFYTYTRHTSYHPHKHTPTNSFLSNFFSSPPPPRNAPVETETITNV